MDRPSGLPHHLFKGRSAEHRARRHLERHGLTFIEANYRCRAGEIDLIMQEQSSVVFIEVRYRTSEKFGGAIESIDFRKQRKLRKTAEHYLQCKYPKSGAPPCRIDVVLITASSSAQRRPRGGSPRVEWIRNAF